MAAERTLLNQLPATIINELEWTALVEAEIPEAPLAIMRYERLRQLLPHWAGDDELKARVLDSAKGGAVKANRRLRSNPELAAYYSRRAEVRTAFQSMQLGGAALQQQVDAVPRPTGPVTRKPAELVITVVQQREADEQAMRELAAGLRPDLERFAAARLEPVFAPRERSAAAVSQRRDWAALERKWKRAVAFVAQEERAKSRRFEEAEAKIPGVVTDNSAPRKMRGVDFQRLTAPEKVLHDHLLLAHWGVPIPRASVHMQGHIPLHRRPGLR